MQKVHAIMTNIAYYNQTKLSAAQRVPLRDIAFEALPTLTGSWWLLSEYIFWFMFCLSIGLILSIFLVRWSAPHGRSLYVCVIFRRILMTVVCLQVLRCISFLVTTLPGPSRQCLYEVPEYLNATQMIEGSADDSGNPSQWGWAPPKNISDILSTVNTSKGCGDLMFSSHTIFTMTFVCITYKYFNWCLLKIVMTVCQVVILPLILMAKKHYTIDVFTALYATPLVFEILWIYFPDWNSSLDMSKNYGIVFRNSEGSFTVTVWGKDFKVDIGEVPYDLYDESISTNTNYETDLEQNVNYKAK